ncbi:TRIM71 [Mytilus edulis]|uniref:TRIM71 n=1 Tax=Mytilus edulis TaxID=6550 RepID=A0A8S3U9U9_MYTED|nr:TRIM71 [Mytilus edulis]
MKTQSKAIIAHVMFTRLKLNQHLDCLERDVLKKVSEQENNALQKMGIISRDLKGKEDRIDDLYKGFIKMQNHASELQIFLGTKEFELEVRRRENEIDELAKGDSLDINCTVFQENIELASFTCDVSSFGEIGLQITPSTTIYTKPKEQQAQTIVEGNTFDDINLKLVNEVKFAGSYVWGCAILEDDTLCIACPNTKTLLLKNTYESLLHKIILPDKPYDITYINEQTLAVTTSNYSSTIFIVNLKTKKVEKTINTEYRFYGISFSDGNLIIHSSDVGLISLNLESGRITELGIGNKVFDAYVAVHDGKIYCTNPAGQSIHCYNVNKSLAWKFKEKSLIAPRGIAVDKKGMVYVGDQRGGNVLIISPDGSKHRVIKIDMIPRPRTLSFNKARTRLLICGEDGTVGIFVIT